MYNKPYLSSSLDDTFFILKKVLQRLVATSSCATHKRMCTEIRGIMEKDFGEILKKRMDGVWSGISSTAQASRQKEEAQARQSFIVSQVECHKSLHTSNTYRVNADYMSRIQVYANDLDVAAEYILRVTEEQLDSNVLGQSYFLDTEYEEAREALESILNLQERYRTLLKVSDVHISDRE